MNQRHLASVLFAVLGAFIALSWLPQLVLAIGIWAAGHEAAPRAYALTLVIAAFIAVTLGIVLVLIRVRLAERLFPLDAGSLAGQETQAVALSVVGCYVVVTSLSRLGWHGRIDWSAAIQLALGVGLFFGARRVARFWVARTTGSSSSNDRGA